MNDATGWAIRLIPGEHADHTGPTMWLGREEGDCWGLFTDSEMRMIFDDLAVAEAHLEDLPVVAEMKLERGWEAEIVVARPASREKVSRKQANRVGQLVGPDGEDFGDVTLRDALHALNGWAATDDDDLDDDDADLDDDDLDDDLDDDDDADDLDDYDGVIVKTHRFMLGETDHDHPRSDVTSYDDVHGFVDVIAPDAATAARVVNRVLEERIPEIGGLDTEEEWPCAFELTLSFKARRFTADDALRVHEEDR